MSDERPFAAEDAEEDAPQVPNAADRKHHRRIKDSAKRAEAGSAAFWAGVFDSETGRREMWDILAVSGAFRERFVTAGPQGFPQPEATWCNAGEQRLGFRLYLSWLRRCPDGVHKMLMENHADLRPPPKLPRRR